MKKSIILITSIILLVSSLRYLILLILNINASALINYVSTIFLFFLVIIFSKPLNIFKWRKNRYLFNLIILNFFFGLIWLVINNLINGFSINAIRQFLFLFISPLSIIIFFYTPKKILKNLIIFITFIVSVSCCIDFYVSNFFPGGIIGAELKSYYLTKITPPETEIIPARIGMLMRAHGITGNYHDSANLLTFSLLFLIGNYVKGSLYNVKNILLLVFGLVGLISTLSLANIIAFIVGIIILNFYNKKFLIIRTSLSLMFILTFFLVFDYNFNLFEFVLPQLDPTGSKFQAMLNTGDSSFFRNVITFIFGHENLTNISNIGFYSEAAFVVLISSIGILPFTSLMLILLFPIFNYFKFKNEDFFSVISVAIGTLTLWHYGSLFRISSIFIFFAIYSISIRNYLLNYEK